MPLWKLEPRVPPEDPAWQDQAIWGEVVVRAKTAGMARMKAADFDRDYDQPPVGDASLSYRSAFENDILYSISRLDAVSAARHGGDAGPEGVVCARRLGARREPRASAGRRAGGAPARTSARARRSVS